MAFAGFNRTNNAPMSEINMVPLIDVMLVLLVIFIVTAPLLSHSVDIDLPKATATPKPVVSETIEVSIDAAGARIVDGKRFDRLALQQRFGVAAKASNPPRLYLTVDQAAPYRFVAETLADASVAGITQIGFVSRPEGD